MQDITQYGVVGVCVLLILKEVFSFLKVHRPDKAVQLLERMDRRLARLEVESTALHDAHLGPNAIDADGAPKWYVRQSLTDAIVKLTDVIEGLGGLIKELHTEMKDVRRSVNSGRK